MREDGQNSVSAMVGASGASLMAVGRVHKGALISAKHMVVASGAHGGKRDQILVLVELLVIGLLGAKPVSVLHTVHWFKTIVFMVAGR